ncbi:hypothetical protein SEMRO_3509_G348720.1 [Seminavis robusta]|uniref:Uncharacterized protein n=1 Tax=Seminavis robusta TaxID=568900 RepID=A0A9N8F2C8_9STRA|nr:hypothetical protein SEMRO_3509_G348720.1 [Seminavis robusta]|eukprot:Sro3509_g348720.1 n/a (260) ;mRNA; f:3564-4434
MTRTSTQQTRVEQETRELEDEELSIPIYSPQPFRPLGRRDSGLWPDLGQQNNWIDESRRRSAVLTTRFQRLMESPPASTLVQRARGALTTSRLGRLTSRRLTFSQDDSDAALVAGGGGSRGTAGATTTSTSRKKSKSKSKPKPDSEPTDPPDDDDNGTPPDPENQLGKPGPGGPGGPGGGGNDDDTNDDDDDDDNGNDDGEEEEEVQDPNGEVLHHLQVDGRTLTVVLQDPSGPHQARLWDKEKCHTLRDDARQTFSRI